jgi:hypothetical protein
MWNQYRIATPKRSPLLSVAFFVQTEDRVSGKVTLSTKGRPCKFLTREDTIWTWHAKIRDDEWQNQRQTKTLTLAEKYIGSPKTGNVLRFRKLWTCEDQKIIWSNRLLDFLQIKKTPKQSEVLVHCGWFMFAYGGNLRDKNKKNANRAPSPSLMYQFMQY